MDDPTWLEKARGYIDLGMLDEAWRELEKLPPSREASEQAQEMRIIVLLDRGEHEKAFANCEVLCDLHPENHAGYVQGAWCLHAGGDPEAAIAHLQSGPESLREEPVYFYNLACYEVALGRAQAAVTWLRQALAMDSSFREKALEDPDLAPIREDIAGIDSDEE